MGAAVNNIIQFGTFFLLLIYSILALLSQAECDFLLQKGEISKNQQRYIRYKLRRKIKPFYDNELPHLIEQGNITCRGSVAANNCGLASCSHDHNLHDNKSSAGSGNFVPFTGSSNPSVLSDMGLAIRKHPCLAISDSNSSTSDSQLFETYLKSQNKRNIRQIVSYAQRYHNVLETADVSPLINLQSGAMRRHAMESLTCLSKYLGCYDRWQEIRKRYQLHWTSGDESVKSLERFFNPDLTFDNIYDRIDQMIAKTPIQQTSLGLRALPDFGPGKL
jgi:hypothetical protein